MSYYVSAEPPDLAPLAAKIWYWPVVRGVLALAFGIVAMVFPFDAPRALVQVFGVFVIVDGLVSLVDGLRRRRSAAGSANLGVGLVAVIFGLILLLLPQVVLGVALLLIALWAFAFGVFQIFVAFALRPRGGWSWVWGLISGLLFIALAVVCVVSPRGTLGVMAVVVGIFAVVIGISLIVLGFMLRSLGKSGPRGTGEVIEGTVVEP
jgi:uncharacterized membrane protein HdeD (DUF308 family)